MLNPELLEKYGRDSVEFFNPLVSAIGIELADKCYALTSRSYKYDGFWLPSTIVVCGDNKMSWDFNKCCIPISIKMQEESSIATGDDIVVGISCSV